MQIPVKIAFAAVFWYDWTMRKSYKTGDATQLAYDIFIKMTFGYYSPLSAAPSDLKNLCKRMSKVLSKAIELNINTDRKHFKQIQFALKKLERSFKDKDFEPLYIIGLFDIIFLLLGDLPSNSRLRTRTNIGRHFFLKARRELTYVRNLKHKVNTILTAHIEDEKFGKKIKFEELTRQFREETKKDIRSQDFINWYSEKFPYLYSNLF